MCIYAKFGIVHDGRGYRARPRGRGGVIANVKRSRTGERRREAPVITAYGWNGTLPRIEVVARVTNPGALTLARSLVHARARGARAIRPKPSGVGVATTSRPSRGNDPVDDDDSSRPTGWGSRDAMQVRRGARGGAVWRRCGAARYKGNFPSAILALSRCPRADLP